MRKIEDQHYKTKDHVPYVDIHYIPTIICSMESRVSDTHAPVADIIWKNLYKERREKNEMSVFRV